MCRLHARRSQDVQDAQIKLAQKFAHRLRPFQGTGDSPGPCNLLADELTV